MNVFMNDSFHLEGEGNGSCIETFHELETMTNIITLDLSIAGFLSKIEYCREQSLLKAVQFNDQFEWIVEASGRTSFNSELVNVVMPRGCDYDSRYPIYVDGGCAANVMYLTDESLYLTSAASLKSIARILKVPAQSGMGTLFRDAGLASAVANHADELLIHCTCRSDDTGVKRIVGCFSTEPDDPLKIDDVMDIMKEVNASVPYRYEVETWSVSQQERGVTLNNYVDDAIRVTWSDTGTTSLTVEKLSQHIRPMKRELGSVLHELAAENY